MQWDQLYRCYSWMNTNIHKLNKLVDIQSKNAHQIVNSCLRIEFVYRRASPKTGNSRLKPRPRSLSFSLSLSHSLPFNITAHSIILKRDVHKECRGVIWLTKHDGLSPASMILQLYNIRVNLV